MSATHFPRSEAGRFRKGYNGGARLGPRIGSTVRLNLRRPTSVGTELWRGQVQGADVSQDCALVRWLHQPTTLHRIPYSWLVEVAS